MNIGATFGLDVGSLIGGWLNYKGQKQANDTNLEIARQNNEFNERMWHMQNEYNTPAAQMQRYREAGLNPNLIYGSTSNGNASAAPVATPVSVENTRAGDAFLGQMAFSVDSVLNVMKKMEEIKTQKATTQNVEADTASKQNENSIFYINAQMRLAQLDGQVKANEQLLANTELSKAQRDNIYQNIEHSKAQIALINKQIDKTGYDAGISQIEYNRLKWYNSGNIPNFPRNKFELIGWLSRHSTELKLSPSDKGVIDRLIEKLRNGYSSYKRNIASPIQSGLDFSADYLEDIMLKTALGILTRNMPKGNIKK